MTTTSTPVFEYAYAKKVADRVIDLLSPHSEKISLAGSVRRECMYVKDIEVVVIPKKTFVATDLFGGGSFAVCKEFIQAIDLMQESIMKGNATGRYMQMVLKGGIKLDLFLPEPDDYYRQLTIRTGSKEFVKNFIANRWTVLGWCGTKNAGLRRKRDCISRMDHEGKPYWICINTQGEVPPVWKSEIDFFDWLGLRWVEPKYR